MNKTYVHIAMDTIENNFSVLFVVHFSEGSLNWLLFLICFRIRTMTTDMKTKLTLILITKEPYDLISYWDTILIFKGDYTQSLIQTLPRLWFQSKLIKLSRLYPVALSMLSIFWPNYLNFRISAVSPKNTKAWKQNIGIFAVVCIICESVLRSLITISAQHALI